MRPSRRGTFTLRTTARRVAKLTGPAPSANQDAARVAQAPAEAGKQVRSDPAVRRLMWFFAVVYAVEGIGQAKGGVVWQPLVWFLKEVHGWTPLQISAGLAVFDIPWIIKPLYGAISDFLPLFGYRRRGYLLLANIAAVAAFLWVAREHAPAAIVLAMLATSAAMAISSTLCGALLVENGQRYDRNGAFVNQQWLWYNVAAVLVSLIGGGLVQLLSPAGALHTAALAAAVAPLAVVVGLPLVREQRAHLDPAGLRNSARAFVAAFRSRALWLVAGFLFCYYFSPHFGTPLYFYMTDRLRFSQAFIGALASVNAVGWIAGGLLFRWVLEQWPTGLLLRLSILCGVLSTLGYLGMVDPVSAVLVYFVAGVAGMIANNATLTLAAERCPSGAEGFAFAGLMSVINLSMPLSDTVGSFLYEHVFHETLAPLILVSAVFTAFVLVLMRVFRIEEEPLASAVET